MMEHAQGGLSKRQSINLHGLLDNQINLAYHSFRTAHHGFQVIIEREYPNSEYLISAQPHELGKAIFNILQNALDSVLAKAQLNTQYQPKINIQVEKIPNEVCIKIHDNGCGIPTELQDHIFSPFFSTKSGKLKRAGLGLSISYDIITTGHQGKIEIDSKLNEYASFNIILPANSPK
jgi:signal transduction histidine kinase